MKVAIVMGSDSDWGVMKAAAVEFAKSAADNGYDVIIAGAGGAAHLPGMVASCTTLPVIGVPVKASSLEGMDSLLSIVQMPRGIPVATVAINNSTNAALLAVRMLSIGHQEYRQKLANYADSMANMSRAKTLS